MSDHDPLEAKWLELVQQQVDRLFDTFDRTVVALAGGALVLSITFISEIAAQPPVSTAKLGWAWGLLVASLIFMAMSYIPSIVSHRRVLRGDDAGWLGPIADGLSLFSFVLMAVGLGSLAAFAFDNTIGGGK